MPSGPGYWFDPTRDRLYRVTTHNDWLLLPQNQAAVGLTDKEKRVLASLDPDRQIDEIRMVGVMHGLIRFREYSNRLSVQFYCDSSRSNEILKAVAHVVPRVTTNAVPYLTVHNLYDDSVARLPLKEVAEKLTRGNVVLRPSEDIYKENNELRKRMAELLTSNPSET
jgi:hypothetical protein